MNVKEFQIPVPWGHIAGKNWGNEEDDAILVIHGLSDNAGTFDRIIPLLLPNYYYICIDLPSHGFSSPYPPHLFISALDNVFAIKLIVEYLNRPNLILMGHSWGAQASMLYCQLFPQNVSKLIMIDSIYLFPLQVEKFREIMVRQYEGLTKISKNNGTKRVTYTKEEAINKLMDGRSLGPMSRESTEILFKRSVVPVGDNKFQFTADPRLKYFINALFDLRFVVDLMDQFPVTCPILYISSYTTRFQYAYFKPLIEKLKLHNKNFVIERVEGGHDVHSDKPEVVAPLINKFLLTFKNKL